MVGSVFAYGTLMPGGPLWPVLEPYAASWRPAAAAGRMWDTGRGYPAVRFLADGNPVPGVLVDIIPDLLAEATVALDRIEEVGVLYRRSRSSRPPARPWPTNGSATAAMATLTGGWPTAGP